MLPFNGNPERARKKVKFCVNLIELKKKKTLESKANRVQNRCLIVHK